MTDEKKPGDPGYEPGSDIDKSDLQALLDRYPYGGPILLITGLLTLAGAAIAWCTS